MSKKACEKKEFRDKSSPDFVCRKCGAKVNKESRVCKPEKLK